MENKADWDHWSHMEIVSLGEAVMLAFDKDPRNTSVHSSFSNPFIPDFLDRCANTRESQTYDMAVSCIGQKKGLEARKSNRSIIPREMPCVSLPEFGAWLNRRGFSLPKGFPITRTSSSLSRPDGTTLELPYACEFMTKISTIMFANYEDIPANGAPNQTKVALEIDEAMEWTNQILNEKASRPAVAIAALIQPVRFQKKAK